MKNPDHINMPVTLSVNDKKKKAKTRAQSKLEQNKRLGALSDQEADKPPQDDINAMLEDGK